MEESHVWRGPGAHEVKVVVVGGGVVVVFYCEEFADGYRVGVGELEDEGVARTGVEDCDGHGGRRRGRCGEG